MLQCYLDYVLLLGSILARVLRKHSEKLTVAGRQCNFNEVEHVLTSEAAVKEAKRCLRCYRVLTMSLEVQNQPFRR